MRLPLPKEHGAWVMTILSLVAGWNVGEASWSGASLFASVAVVAALLAQAAWLDPLAPRWLWKLEGSISVQLVGLAGTGTHTHFWGVSFVAGALGVLAQAWRSGERKGNRVRLTAYAAHLIGVCAIASSAGLVMAARGESLPFIVRTWAILSVSFAASVAFVQAAMPGPSRSIVPSLGVAATTIVIVGICHAFGFDASRTFISVFPVFLRLPAVSGFRRLRPSWKLAGWIETLSGIWTVTWLIGA